MTSTFDIIFNNESSYSKGLYVVRRPDIPAPEPIYEPYEIPGHDGILMPVDMRYGPLEIDVEMNFMSSDPNTWGDAYRVAKEWLHGSGQLYLSDDNAMFYNVYMVSIVDSERVSRRIGSFTARFICEPYTYAKSGETRIFITNEFKCMRNQFPTDSKPLIEIQTEGNENGTVKIAILEDESTHREVFSIETVDGYYKYIIDSDKSVVYAFPFIALEDQDDPDIWNTHASGKFEDLYLPQEETCMAALPSPAVSGQTYAPDVWIMPRWRTL